MSQPPAPLPADLPDAFAAALGRAVAGFGFLEEALKRGIHALSLARLTDDGHVTEAELQDWIGRMHRMAGDSLGELIDSFVAALSRAGKPDRTLAAELRDLREWRNMICHASWVPAASPAAGFRPGFVSNRGRPAPKALTAADLDALLARSRAAAAGVIACARGTGHDSWSADPAAAPRAAERARARARAAAAAAQRPAPRGTHRPGVEDEDAAPPHPRHRARAHR